MLSFNRIFLNSESQMKACSSNLSLLNNLSKSSFRLSLRVSSWVFLLSAFFASWTVNPIQVLPDHSPKPFLTPIVFCTPLASSNQLLFFAQVIASIISTVAKYPLIDMLVYPATRCSTIPSFPSLISPWVVFQDLISIICCSIDMIDYFFCEWRFWVAQSWHSHSCSLKKHFVD